MIGSAALGALATVLTRGEPGTMLGIFLIAGTIAAGLAVTPRASYLLIPVPPLAYLAAAIAAGITNVPASAASRTTLAISAAQWAARGFLTTTAATALAIVIAGARRHMGTRPAASPRTR